jgi:hypothetical protein
MSLIRKYKDEDWNYYIINILDIYYMKTINKANGYNIHKREYKYYIEFNLCKQKTNKSFIAIFNNKEERESEINKISEILDSYYKKN